MADVSAKQAKDFGNYLLGWVFWAANFVLGLAAIAIIATAFVATLGVKVPYIRVLPFTELAYAMGAYYLYRKAAS